MCTGSTSHTKVQELMSPTRKNFGNFQLECKWRNVALATLMSTVKCARTCDSHALLSMQDKLNSPDPSVESDMCVHKINTTEDCTWYTEGIAIAHMIALEYHYTLFYVLCNHDCLNFMQLWLVMQRAPKKMRCRNPNCKKTRYLKLWDSYSACKLVSATNNFAICFL